MEATRPDRPTPTKPPRPGVGLATCAVAIATLSMLGYAVATRKPAATPAGDVSHAEPSVNAGPTTPFYSVGSDTPAQRGALRPWPAPAIALDPPAYESPYPVATSPPAYELPPVARPADEINPTLADPLAPSAAQTPADEIVLDLPLPPPPVEATEVIDPAPVAVLPKAPIDPSPVVVSDSPAISAETPMAGPMFAAPPGGSEEQPPMPGPSAINEPDVLSIKDSVEDAFGNADVDLLNASLDAEATRAGSAPLDELLVDTPAPEHVSKLLAEEVRQAFSLGRHGAVFAARSRFIGVLRKVATAKDAAGDTDRHSLALAAGLHALEEAAAFVPKGDALETDLDVEAIAASHKTPLFNQSEAAPRWVLPHEAIARYQRYAQHKLAIVARGDQAASMALHGLGKTYARLEDLGDSPLAGRTSLTMYRAAIEAHPGNYLAANELGVGLAKAGRYKAAHDALALAIASGGNSTVYRNLAVVQQNLGQKRLAGAAETRAEQLAAAERSAGAFSRERGVEWVAPEQFSRVADAYSRKPAAPHQTPQVAQRGPQPQQALSQRALPQPEPRRSLASRLMPWKKSQTTGAPANNVLAAQPQPQAPPAPAYPQNPTAAPVRSQTIVR